MRVRSAAFTGISAPGAQVGRDAVVFTPFPFFVGVVVAIYRYYHTSGLGTTIHPHYNGRFNVLRKSQNSSKTQVLRSLSQADDEEAEKRDSHRSAETRASQKPVLRASF